MTYDVTSALNAASFAVFMADIYVEPVAEAAPAGRRPQVDFCLGTCAGVVVVGNWFSAASCLG